MKCDDDIRKDNGWNNGLSSGPNNAASSSVQQVAGCNAYFVWDGLMPSMATSWGQGPMSDAALAVISVAETLRFRSFYHFIARRRHFYGLGSRSCPFCQAQLIIFYGQAQMAW